MQFVSQPCLTAFSGCSCVYGSVFISRSVLGCVTFSVNHQLVSGVPAGSELTTAPRRHTGLRLCSPGRWQLVLCLDYPLSFAPQTTLHYPCPELPVPFADLSAWSLSGPRRLLRGGTGAVRGLAALGTQERGLGLAASAPRAWEAPGSWLDLVEPPGIFPSWVGSLWCGHVLCFVF